MKFILVSLLFSFSYHVFANEVDSAIYVSDYEKELFTAYLRDSTIVNPVDFLYAFNEEKHSKNKLAEQRIQQQFKAFDKIDLESKSTKKKVKTIYSDVHQNFFKKYEFNVPFDQIFSHGTYNCATASAIYCVFLEKYGIPYNIMERPQHVYIVANADGKPVLMESTSPSDGVFIWDNKYKSEFVKYLRDNKIISKNEFDRKTLSELFDEYHNKDTKINLKQLIGLLYLNKAVKLLEKQDFKGASYELQKGNILYKNSTSIKYLLYACQLNLLNNEVIEKSFNARHLATFINKNYENEEIKWFSEEYFNHVSNEYIIEHPDIEAYQDFYNELIKNLSSSVEITLFKDRYHRSCAYYYETKSDYYNALYNLDKAYLLNTQNIEVKEAVISLCNNYVISHQDTRIAIDSAQSFTQHYPFLFKDTHFMQNYYNLLAKEVIQDYMFRDVKKATSNLIKLEHLLDDKEILKPNLELVEAVYASAANYYLERRKYNLAEEYIDKGTKYVPGSRTLRLTRSEILRSRDYDRPPTF